MKHDSQKRSQVTLAALAAGFGVARFMTAPLRRYYERRYKARHSMPRVLFVFDALLVCIVIALAIFVVWIIAMPAMPVTVQANFQSTVFRAGGTSPSTVFIQSTSQTIQRNVRVRWLLPAGITVYQASPAMTQDGTVYVGDILPGQTVASHAVLQTLRQEGGLTPIEFQIFVGGVLDARVYTAAVTRKVEGSALRADIPVEFRADRVSANGAYLPLRIENTSDRTIPFVEVRPSDDASILFDPISLGSMQPGDAVFAYLPFGSVSGTAHLAWTIGAASRDLTTGSFDAQVIDASFAAIEDGLIASRDGSAVVHVVGGVDQHLLSVRPFLAQSILDSVMTSDDASISLATGSVAMKSQQRWMVAPMIVDATGVRSLGPATFGVVRTTIPFTASIVYRNAAGDQLGAGPQPPVPGEETRYWVFWHVGPFDADVKSVHVHAALPQGVRATGAVSSSEGGSWSFSDESADWRVNPSLNAGTNDLSFGFEIAIRPDAEISSTQQLLGESSLSAIDVASEAKLSSTDAPKTVGEVIGL